MDDVVKPEGMPILIPFRATVSKILVGGGIVAAIGAGVSGLVVAGRTMADVDRLSQERPEITQRLRAVETEMAGLKSTVQSSSEAQQVLLGDILERLREQER